MRGHNRSTSTSRIPTGFPSTSTMIRISDSAPLAAVFAVLATLAPLPFLLDSIIGIPRPLFELPNRIGDMSAADSVFIQQRFRRSGPRNLANRELYNHCLVSNRIQDGVAQTAFLVMIFNNDHSPACSSGRRKKSFAIDRLH